MICTTARMAVIPNNPAIRIDLEWAKQRIEGFSEMLETQARVKASEAEYRKLKGEKK